MQAHMSRGRCISVAWGLSAAGRAGIQDLEKALSGGDGPRQAIDDAGGLAYREGELVHVEDELGQAAAVRWPRMTSQPPNHRIMPRVQVKYRLIQAPFVSCKRSD